MPTAIIFYLLSLIFYLLFFILSPSPRDYFHLILYRNFVLDYLVKPYNFVFSIV